MYTLRIRNNTYADCKSYSNIISTRSRSAVLQVYTDDQRLRMSTNSVQRQKNNHIIFNSYYLLRTAHSNIIHDLTKYFESNNSTNGIRFVL